MQSKKSGNTVFNVAHNTLTERSNVQSNLKPTIVQLILNKQTQEAIELLSASFPLPLSVLYHKATQNCAGRTYTLID
jgi:hypothetical protein